MDYQEADRRPDLDSIEELNYISTVEEDAVIDAHIEELRAWGYGSIMHAHDLHQLFWEFSRRGVILDKLFRVAVVECIDDETLYTRFLGMARHYNGWAQKQKEALDRDQKGLRRELAELKSENETLRRNYSASKEKVGRLSNEIAALRQAARPRSEGEQINALRHELRKEYNIRLQEQRHKARPDRTVGKTMLRQLRTPATRLFEAFDLTEEDDAREYVGWFRLGSRKINTATLRCITERYGEENIRKFLDLAAEYNREWEASHQGEQEKEDDD